MHKITNRKSEFILAMEATSHYWLALYTRLCREGYRAILLNPIQIHAVREMLNYGDTKTDEIDTLAIAEAIRFGRYKPSRVPQDMLRAQVFPEFETQFSTIFGKAALAVLKQYPTAEKLARAQLGKLTQLLQTASSGCFGEWKALQLRETAKGSFGIPDCEGVYSTLILLHLQQLQSLLDGAAALERQMAEIFSQFDTPLTSIPGIGPLLGAAILSEIRDISSFSSADNLLSYAGLNPRVKQSGETKFGGIHMSKRGSPYLRRA